MYLNETIYYEMMFNKSIEQLFDTICLYISEVEFKKFFRANIHKPCNFLLSIFLSVNSFARTMKGMYMLYIYLRKGIVCAMLNLCFHTKRKF